MASTGIRQLKDNLSRYVRRVEAGERIAVTAHGRVVAEVVPPAQKRSSGSGYEALVAAGVIEPAVETGRALPAWPDIRPQPGLAAELIDSDRGSP